MDELVKYIGLSKGQKSHLRKLGLSYSEISQIEQTRLYKCGLCGRKRDLVIDHNHKTNEFRDLLCVACNIGLGLFNDDPKLLLKAVFYLKRHK